MQKRSIFALLPILLLPGAAIGQTDPSLWRFVHPDAKALISIDWKRLRQSSVGSMMREKFVDGNAAANAIPGIEFLDDVERFVISSPGKDPNDEKAEPPVLIVLRGHFDLLKIRKSLAAHHARAQAYNTYQVYRSQDKTSKDMAVVLLDPQNILIGDAHSIFSSLEPSPFAATPREPNSILARATQMDASYDLWMVMTAPGALAGDRLMAMFMGDEQNSEPAGFEVGMSFRNGLSADIVAMLQNEAAAKKMVSELSKMLKMGIKDKIGEPAVLDLERHLKFTAEGSNAKITLRMTPQEVEKNTKIFTASKKKPPTALDNVRAMLSQPEPAPIIAPPPPPKPENRVIRIEGLDDGPRDIPYKPDRPEQR